MFDDTKKFKDYASITDIKTAVVDVINKNIAAGGPLLEPVREGEELHIKQNGVIVLSDKAFNVMTDLSPMDSTMTYDNCGDKCSNVLAYIQYYVALACKCVSMDTDVKDDGKCYINLDQNVADDFNVANAVDDLTGTYETQIVGTEDYHVTIANGVMSLIKKDKNIMSVPLKEYRSDRIRHICLICIYYFTVCALYDDSKKDKLNTPNLHKIIQCWSIRRTGNIIPATETVVEEKAPVTKAETSQGEGVLPVDPEEEKAAEAAEEAASESVGNRIEPTENEIPGEGGVKRQYGIDKELTDEDEDVGLESNRINPDQDPTANEQDRSKAFGFGETPGETPRLLSSGGRPRGRKASPRSAGASEWFNTGRKDSRTGKTVWQNLKTGHRVTKSYVTSAATGKRTVRHMSVAR